MSSAARVDLEVDQGADFGIQIYWTSTESIAFPVIGPMRMEVRDSVGNVAVTLQTTEDSENMVTGTSSILYNTESGLIQLNMSAAQTELLSAGAYDYDLFVSYTDNVVTGTIRKTRLIHGKVHVNGRITRNV